MGDGLWLGSEPALRWLLHVEDEGGTLSGFCRLTSAPEVCGKQLREPLSLGAPRITEAQGPVTGILGRVGTC